MKKQENFSMLNDTEHVLAKIPMYAGSDKLSLISSYVLENGVMIKKDIEAVPAINKLISELIDNSVDEYIRTNGEYANKIEVTINGNTVNVKDNGRGIPVKKVQTYKGEDWQPKLSWTELKAGTNFSSENETTIGTFGVGSSLCSILSTEFIGISNDGENSCKVHCKNNNETIDVKVTKTNKHGCDVTMNIDMKRFASSKLNVIDDNHLKLVEQRLLNLSVTYPDITFILNSKKIKSNDKTFLNMFGEGLLEINKDYSFGIYNSESEEFQQFTLLNGLTISDGGNHIDYIIGNISNAIRDKLVKKYKNIKPGDIKSKIKFAIIMKNFKRPIYNSQTKEKLTNDRKEIIEYFKDTDFDKLVSKILKTPSIIDPITEVYKIKEEFKKRQELKGLQKTIKKIKSEKYTRPSGSNKLLVICEGQSAKNGLMPGLGRDGIGYYELRGKPMNVYEASSSKFANNKELSELYQIILNENYEKIAIASDADLDGIAINGLMIAFFNMYLKDLIKDNKFFRLQTPVMALLDKNKMPKEWMYDLTGELKEKSGLTFKYFKGLGGYTPEQLKKIIEIDGMEKMLLPLELDILSDETIDDWYSSSKADKRKENIMNNDFNLIKL